MFTYFRRAKLFIGIAVVMWFVSVPLPALQADPIDPAEDITVLLPLVSGGGGGGGSGGTVVPPSTSTPTGTLPATATPTATPTGTLPATATPTTTPTGTLPATATPTTTPTGTLPATATPTTTPTGTLPATATPTTTPTGTLPATATPTTTPTSTPTGTLPATSTSTATGTPTATATFTSTPTPLPPAEEILIAAGSFQMGCDQSNPQEATCFPDELPLHSVTLDAYFIEKYEVTNVRYQACVNAGGCTAPQAQQSVTRPTYYTDSAYANFPVINVTWSQAEAYCSWAGKRLPTEAEWEKAARSNSDTRKYPWGNTAPTCSEANFEGCAGDTTQVGTHPTGASAYGVEDMAGNVREWVSDWYSADYYATSPGVNPQGPASGTEKVLRGGSWFDEIANLRVAARVVGEPIAWLADVGFRCARQ